MRAYSRIFLGARRADVRKHRTRPRSSQTGPRSTGKNVLQTGAINILANPTDATTKQRGLSTVVQTLVRDSVVIEAAHEISGSLRNLGSKAVFITFSLTNKYLANRTTKGVYEHWQRGTGSAVCVHIYRTVAVFEAKTEIPFHRCTGLHWAGIRRNEPRRSAWGTPATISKTGGSEDAQISRSSRIVFDDGECSCCSGLSGG